jgi:aldose 1-epimerase
MRNTVLAATLAIGLGAFVAAEASAAGTIEKSVFGKLADGTPVELYTVTNAKGLVMKVMTYGAVMTELQVPDRNGKISDITLGFDNLEQYTGVHPYFGSTIGRVANRIAKGKFTLEGKDYTLAVNDGPNALHGGLKGFNRVLWKAEPIEGKKEGSVKFSYVSKDGEEGYPGSVSVTVTYTLTDKNELKIEYTATTDKATPINLTNHSYYNLAGEGDVLGHEMWLNAKAYTPVDDTLIPTGELAPVKGTPMDFTKPHLIGDRLGELTNKPQGYDHNYVLNRRKNSDNLVLALRVREPKTGRVMSVYTTEPGIQFYTGNFLDGTLKGKGGTIYKQHYAFCVEADHFPDGIHQPNFPNTILHPGETYHQLTIEKFSTY